MNLVSIDSSIVLSALCVYRGDCQSGAGFILEEDGRKFVPTELFRNEMGGNPLAASSSAGDKLSDFLRSAVVCYDSTFVCCFRGTKVHRGAGAFPISCREKLDAMRSLFLLSSARCYLSVSGHREAVSRTSIAQSADRSSCRSGFCR